MNHYYPITKTFDCSHKNLRVLKKIPPETEILICSHNNLEKLPTLPENLRVLNCSHNKLTILGPINRKLIHLDATHNNLQRFPDITNMIKIYEDNRNNNYNPIQAKVLLKHNPFMNKMKEMKKYHSFIKQKNEHLEQHQEKFMTNNHLITNYNMHNFNKKEYNKISTLGKTRGTINNLPNPLIKHINSYLYGKAGNKTMKSKRKSKRKSKV